MQFYVPSGIIIAEIFNEHTCTSFTMVRLAAHGLQQTNGQIMTI